MGFSITSDIGPLGGLLIGLMLLAGGIVLIWLLSLTRRAREEIIEEDAEHDRPIL